MVKGHKRLLYEELYLKMTEDEDIICLENLEKRAAWGMKNHEEKGEFIEGLAYEPLSLVGF